MITLSIPDEPAILNGFELGFNIRQKLNLNEIDFSPDPTVIKITSGIITISFATGLIEHSVLNLGYDGFFNKYSFEALIHVKIILESAVRLVESRMRNK